MLQSTRSLCILYDGRESDPQRDSVGGVTVMVNDDFTGVDDTLIKGEAVTLYGVHAMNFVRSRMSMKDDPVNINRLARQREYLNALYSQAEKAFN